MGCGDPEKEERWPAGRWPEGAWEEHPGSEEGDAPELPPERLWHHPALGTLPVPFYFEDGLGYTAHFLCRFPERTARVYAELASRLYFLALADVATSKQREGSALELRFGALEADLGHLERLLTAPYAPSPSAEHPEPATVFARAGREVGRVRRSLGAALPPSVRALAGDELAEPGDRELAYLYHELFLVQLTPAHASNLRQEGLARFAELPHPPPPIATRGRALARDLAQVWLALHATWLERFDGPRNPEEQRLLDQVPTWKEELQQAIDELLAGLPQPEGPGTVVEMSQEP